MEDALGILVLGSIILGFVITVVGMLILKYSK